jgi:hypothetical protein
VCHLLPPPCAILPPLPPPPIVTSPGAALLAGGSVLRWRPRAPAVVHRADGAAGGRAIRGHRGRNERCRPGLPPRAVRPPPVAAVVVHPPSAAAYLVRPPPALLYGETSALLDAWRLLRTADWRACAAAVTVRRAAAGRAPRTVDQCKNRLDYLKKRLKAERSRSKGAPAPPPPPPSVDRLRALLRLAPSVPPGFTSRGGAMPKVGEEEQEEEEEKAESFAAPLPRSWPSVPKRPRTAVALLPLSSSTGHQHGDGRTSCTEVAAALDRLAGTYERVEVAKQEVTRLEERRLEAMPDLEIERMRILVRVAISASAVADAATATAASSNWYMP